MSACQVQSLSSHRSSAVPNNKKTTTKSETETSCFETRIGRAPAACQWLPWASISCVPTRQTPSHITHQIHRAHTYTHTHHTHTHTHENFSKADSQNTFCFVLTNNQAVKGENYRKPNWKKYSINFKKCERKVLILFSDIQYDYSHWRIFILLTSKCTCGSQSNATDVSKER